MLGSNIREVVKSEGVMKRDGLDDLEALLAAGVGERVIQDQLLVASRVSALLNGVREWVEDMYFSLGNNIGMSGNSRHSLALMCSYGNGSPLQGLRLGRYLGNDVLKGSPVDLMGDNSEARRTLREIRSREGIGSLVINGTYSLYHSGVQLPGANLQAAEYGDEVERGSRTEAMIAFSKRHPTHSSSPVWFYKLNGNRSIIQNGREYELTSN